jgi:hypothetical protein
MRWLSVVLTVLIFSLSVFANPDSEPKLAYNPIRLQMAQEMSKPQEEVATDSTASPVIAGKLNPGKALLLSAIIPGAGQFYAKAPIWGAAFIAFEVAAWAGVAVYHQKGMNKDDEFHIFADQHWAYDRGSTIQPQTLPEFNDYLHYEYWAATVFGKDGASGNNDVYLGNIDEWQTESWTSKLQNLPSDGFTHELDPNNEDQQYYEMIGKYNQFGAGWTASGDEVNNYRNNTHLDWKWESKNSFRETYLNMRKESNDALDKSKNFTMVVMANHVLSALHAGFMVSRHNKKLEKAQTIEGSFRLEPRDYAGQKMAMGVMRINF